MLDERKMRLLEARIDGWRIRIKDKDQIKIYDEVFDQKTLMAIYKLISNGTISTVDYPVSTGKEGNVFHATSDDGALALKIYRVSNATFRNLSKYILGDSRFKGLKGNRRKIIYAWATKEYKNLERMHSTGTRVPPPVAVHENVLVMSYIGDETMPAPLLKNVKLEDPQAVLDDVIENMSCIHKADLVHGDLSEYNLLFWNGKTYVIDVGQAVTLEHRQAEEWLDRDIANIVRYFKRQGCDVDVKTVNERVKGG